MRQTHRMATPTDEYLFALQFEWDHLASPGAWWTGPERVSIAAEARLATKGLPPSGALPSAATEAARTIAIDASSIRPDTIARWQAEGLSAFAYVEIVGIVAIVTALDVAADGLMRPEEPLPIGRPGQPSGVIPEGAQLSDGWVPTVGPAWAPEALSAVTAERDAMNTVHGPLYLTMEQMMDLDINRNGMSRHQLEMVAARTSMLNDCFY